MADVIKGVKLSRRNLKGQLTRTFSMIDNLTGDVTLLKKYIAKAEEQFSKIEEKHLELTELLETDEEFEVEEKWMTNCEMDFVQRLVRAKQVVDHHPQSTLDVPNTSTSQEVHQEESTPVAQSPPQSPQQSPPQSPSSANPVRSSHAPKMARIKFPTFSGEIKEYQHFKSMFHHCTQGLSEIECFFQLTEAMLNQKERSLVKSCVNVQRAWQMLDECFGDRDRVVDSLLQDLSSLKSYEFKGKISTSAMAHFVQILQNFECQAETVGLNGELNSKIMLGQIKQKLPESHRMEYYKEVRDGNIDDSLSGLTKWLYQQYLLLEKVKCTSEDNCNKSSRNDRVTKASNATSLDPPKQKKGKGKQSSVPKCALHENSGTHYLKTCNKFRSLPLPEKYSVMKRNNICQRCGHNNCVAGKPPYDLNACQFAAPCKTQNCGSDRHFSAICPVVYGQIIKPQPNGDVDRSTATTASVKTVTSSGLQSTLPTVMGYIRHGNTRHKVRILLDCGSQATFLREGILPKTGKDSYQDYELSLVRGRKITKKLRVLDCQIEDIRGNWSCPLTVTEIDEPCGDAKIVQPEHLQPYDHLRDIELPVAPSETIDLLLGVENTHLMVWEEYVVGDKLDDPVAVRSPFGWYIQGGKSSNSTRLLNYVNVSAIGALEEFLGLETVGTEPKRCKCDPEFLDRVAIEAMEQNVTKRQDGSYEIRLPRKRSPEGLPNNYDYAVKRLKGLENQFRDRPADWKVYCKQMEDQLHGGVSHLVTEEEIQREKRAGKNMCFLPHFAVKKDSATTPVRVVYDSKARFQGHSLNDYLSKGENLNSELFNVALRFRENEIGIIADIRKMFQAVKIRPDDARYHRFVFRKNPGQAVRVYELTVTFGDKPSPAAAIVTLRHVITQHASNDEQLKRVVTDQFYMDDLSESVASVEEALELKRKLTETLKEGNFDIRKWQSNAKTVCDETESADTATVLGTSWDLAEDTLSVKAVKPSDDTTLTKRKILAQTASYYDVFGVLSGLLVCSKVLLQKLWQLDLDWDTPIDRSSELYSMMGNINRDLEEIDSLEIGRCLIPEPYRGKRPLPPVSMHGASDASEDAMGFAVWLRWSHDDSQEAHLSFICARSRVTPLKQTSMPRKELQALLLLSRLIVNVKAALRLDIDGWNHQRMADLPDFRISPCSPPFRTTLVDYLGPVNVKLNRNTTTRGYCALFTCAVTRAVHLTVVQDLSTQAFLQALERFVSTRGAPAVMVSDNATCFRGADNTINELNLKLNQTQVREHCLRYNVQWRFGPPGGPHHQGAVEHMVQEVKKAMRHLVKSDRLTFVEWETIFCKISGLINSRPLTVMSSSPLDHAPLTPNHFLIGRGDLPCPDIPCDDYKGDLQKRQELCNAMVDGFWRRWMECLHKLSPRQKWQKSRDSLQEKDIVLVIGEEKHRGFWKMAEIASVHPGEDNLVRVVSVKFADGKHATNL